MSAARTPSALRRVGADWQYAIHRSIWPTGEFPIRLSENRPDNFRPVVSVELSVRTVLLSHEPAILRRLGEQLLRSADDLAVAYERYAAAQGTSL